MFCYLLCNLGITELSAIHFIYFVQLINNDNNYCIKIHDVISYIVHTQSYFIPNLVGSLNYSVKLNFMYLYKL